MYYSSVIFFIYFNQITVRWNIQNYDLTENTGPFKSSIDFNKNVLPDHKRKNINSLYTNKIDHLRTK